jgi:hypothetical protein
VKETTLTVTESSDPKFTFTCQIEGTTTPFPLTGFTVAECYLKADRSDTDAAAQRKYSTATGEIAVTDAAGGIVTVQFAAADIAAPARRWWHLDVVVSAKRTTLGYGPLVVVDV